MVMKMEIGRISQNQYREGMWSRQTAQKANGSSDQFARQMSNAAGVKPKGYQVYMKTDDMLYSGGNGSGLSFYIKYAEESTRENPIVIAKGVDENGKEFEQTIRINDINPRSATVVEMHALEAYLGVDKSGGLTSLPHDPFRGAMGLYDRADFIDLFQNSVRDMNTLGRRELAGHYRYSLQMYWDFMQEKGKNGSVSTDMNSPFAHWQKQARQGEKKPDGEEEVKSDSEIITQPDGSRTLLITTQIGDTQTVMNIRLSDPSIFPQDPVRPDIPAREGTRTDTPVGKDDKPDMPAAEGARLKDGDRESGENGNGR